MSNKTATAIIWKDGRKWNADIKWHDGRFWKGWASNFSSKKRLLQHIECFPDIITKIEGAAA